MMKTGFAVRDEVGDAGGSCPAGGSLGTLTWRWLGPSDWESSMASSNAGMRRMMRGQASAGFSEVVERIVTFHLYVLGTGKIPFFTSK